jgi:Holliday junction resolvase
MAKRGYKFEYHMRKLLEHYFEDNGISAYVRREFQNVPNFAGTDITVDSPDPRYYLSIECKSRKSKMRYNLKELFKGDQFERITETNKKAGRRGFLAIESRSRPKNKTYLIKWDDVAQLYARGQPSFRMFDPSELPRPVKKDEIAARELVKIDGKWNVGEVFAHNKLGASYPRRNKK